MTEKRFYIAKSNLIEGYCVFDREKKYAFSPRPRKADCLNDTHILNELYEENKNLKDFAQHNYSETKKIINNLQKENEQLKQLIKKLEKQIHLIHMSSMFSTVKSFKGDVSKRYKYSEETDTIYDTANTYGQYSKILDKKEVVMLLNEYETLLKGDVK